jgi:hypothetical protein
MYVYTYVYTCVCIYIYIHVHVCVCVCVCVYIHTFIHACSGNGGDGAQGVEGAESRDLMSGVDEIVCALAMAPGKTFSKVSSPVNHTGNRLQPLTFQISVRILAHSAKIHEGRRAGGGAECLERRGRRGWEVEGDVST